MHLAYRIPLTVLALVAGACGPQSGDSATETAATEPATTEPAATDATEPAATDTTVEPTTTGPTTTGPTTTGDTDPTGGAPVGCERLAGAGDVAWYMRCGGLTHEYFAGSAVDAAGNIYVGVDLRSLEASVPIQFGEFEVVPGDLSDILIVKFDGEGEALWVKHFTGPEDQYIEALRGCGDGFVISGSAPAGTLDLGGGAIAEEDYIASFAADGAHRWSRGVPILAADGHFNVYDMACDADDQLAITGTYRGGIDLGGGPILPTDLYDGYAARFDPTGALLWGRGFGAGVDGTARGLSIAYAPAGELVIVGSFDKTIDLGGGALTAEQGDDALVIKLGPAGEHVWSQHIGPIGLQYGRGAAVREDGQVAFGGIFLDDITIGADSYINVFPDAEEQIDGTLYDGFIGFADADGAVQSSLQVGSKLNDDIYELQFDADGALVMSGFTDEAFTVRAHVDGAATWSWSTPDLLYAHTVVRDDAVLVTSGASEALDLGAGPLAPHGETDLVLVKLRR